LVRRGRIGYAACLASFIHSHSPAGGGAQDLFYNPQQYGVSILSDAFHATATLGSPAAPASVRVLNVRLAAQGQYVVEGNVTTAGAYTVAVTLGATLVETLLLHVAAGPVDLVPPTAQRGQRCESERRGFGTERQKRALQRGTTPKTLAACV
jgi:hypothetical protein